MTTGLLGFNVGDRVRIREWDDMAAEFGIIVSTISCPSISFTKAMSPLCGREYTITGFYRYSGGFEVPYVMLDGKRTATVVRGDYHYEYYISEYMLTHIEEPDIADSDTIEDLLSQFVAHKSS